MADRGGATLEWRLRRKIDQDGAGLGMKRLTTT